MMPMQLIDKIVKNSPGTVNLDDVLLLGVSCDVGQEVVEVLNRIAPVIRVGAGPIQPFCDVSNAVSSDL